MCEQASTPGEAPRTSDNRQAADHRVSSSLLPVWRQSCQCWELAPKGVV